MHGHKRLEAIAADTEQEAGYTLNRSPVHHSADWEKPPHCHTLEANADTEIRNKQTKTLAPPWKPC